MTPNQLEHAYQAFHDELVAHGLLVPSGVPGLLGRGQMFEAVIDGFERYVTATGRNDGARILRFPPVINRSLLEQAEYLKAFPQFAGTVHSFMQGDREHEALLAAVARGDDWSAFFGRTEVALTPAACYPLYPMIAGELPASGLLFDVYGYCFRHEPSIDPARMQAFRQREYVVAGTAAQTHAFRELWLDRGQTMLAAVGLAATTVIAHDPFFGRRGRMLAADQRDQGLKHEMVVPICSAEKPTACVSVNYHQDHFAHLFGIRTPDGALAHSACVGFGVERIALALFKTHGLDTATWPGSVRTVLGL